MNITEDKEKIAFLKASKPRGGEELKNYLIWKRAIYVIFQKSQLNECYIPFHQFVEENFGEMSNVSFKSFFDVLMKRKDSGCRLYGEDIKKIFEAPFLALKRDIDKQLSE